jgi:hypothetical protein
MITLGVREKVKLRRIEVKIRDEIMRCKVGLGESRKMRSFL